MLESGGGYLARMPCFTSRARRMDSVCFAKFERGFRGTVFGMLFSSSIAFMFEPLILIEPATLPSNALLLTQLETIVPIGEQDFFRTYCSMQYSHKISSSFFRTEFCGGRNFFSAEFAEFQ